MQGIVLMMSLMVESSILSLRDPRSYHLAMLSLAIFIELYMTIILTTLFEVV